MKLRWPVSVGIVAGIAMMASGAPAFAEPPEEHFYERQISNRDGSGSCGASMIAPRWTGEFNPGKVSNDFLNGCDFIRGPRTTEVSAGVVR